MFARCRPLADVRSEFHRLQEEMDQLFGRWGVSTPRPYATAVYPPLNVWEDDENLHVETELPGLAMSELEIYVTGENQLSINGERKQPNVEKGSWHCRERGSGSFSRVIELPSRVDSAQVTAQLQQGVLTITLPKREEAKPRRIAVKSE